MIINNYNVHGLKVQLKTDDEKFSNLVSQYYSVFSSRPDFTNPNITVEYSMNIDLNWDEIHAKSKRFGEGIYLTNDSLFWKNEYGFCCSLQIIKKNRWILRGFHYDILKCNDETDVLKNMIRSMRWLIHFPLFEMLNRCMGINLMHASAISSGSSTFIFAGLNKVGKSSLARFFYENLNYFYLSDNFLLHDKDMAYAFPEKVRLTDAAVEYYGIDPLKASNVYGKKQIQIPDNRVLKKTELQRIYYVNNGLDLAVNRISFNEFDTKILCAHRYLKEFGEYEYLSFLDMFTDVVGVRCDNNINKECLFYELTLPLNWDLDSIVAELYKCL